MKWIKPALLSSRPEHIAQAFVRLGWIGLWLQVGLAAFTIGMLLFVLVFSRSAANQQQALGFTDYLALLGIGVMVFTIFWFYRYTRLGAQMPDPARRPPKGAVLRTVWIGLWAGCVGVLFSVVLLVIDVSRIMFIFLRAPQGGLPVVQTATYNSSTWVAASDMAALLSNLAVVSAELIVVGFSIWLLFRMTVPATAYSEASPDSAA